MGLRHRLDAVDREQKLKIERLLAPQRAVVVEHRNALGLWNEGGIALPRNLGNEIEDGAFVCAGIP